MVNSTGTSSARFGGAAGEDGLISTGTPLAGVGGATGEECLTPLGPKALQEKIASLHWNTSGRG